MQCGVLPLPEPVTASLVPLRSGCLGAPVQRSTACHDLGEHTGEDVMPRGIRMLTRSFLFALGWLVPCNLAVCCESFDPADPAELVARKPIQGEELRRSLSLVSRREGDRVRNRPAAMDYESPPGTAVVAVRAGRVVMAQPAAGYDNTVVIDHGAGFKTLYAHLDSFAVRSGDCVGSGQVIGRLAASTADNPVLHFEVTDDGKFLRRLPNLGQP